MSDAIREIIRRSLEQEGLEPANRFYSFYPGTCRSPLDPEMRGRIQVEVPVVSSKVLPTLAIPMDSVFGPGVGPLAEGESFVPDVGSPVIVMFMFGDINKPYYRAGSPNRIIKGNSAISTPTVRSIESKTVRIELNDVTGTFKVSIKPAGPTLEMAVSGLASLVSTMVELGAQGLAPTAGVVTGECACAFTGLPHPATSLSVKAKL